MYLTRIVATGLRNTPHQADLGRTSPLPPLPGAAGLGDALRLFAVALAPARWPELGTLGWVGPHTEPLTDDDTQQIDMLLGLVPDAVDRTVDGPDRTVSVDVSISPDPPLYGRLREHAVRDPRMVTALGQQAELRVKAGFLLTADRSGATPDLLGVRIGDVSFPLSGKDRPAWLMPLLADLAGRIWVLDLAEPIGDVLERMYTHAASHRAEERARWAAAAAALQRAPFGLPAPAWMRTRAGMRLAFGDDLVPLRHLGRAAVDAVRLVEAALVRAPDLLVVPEPLPEEVTTWLHGCTEGDDASLEQVLAP